MPDKDLTVALIPLPIVTGDIEANISLIETSISKLDGSVDLVVLPEMCLSGFKADLKFVKSMSQTINGEGMSAIRRLSSLYNVAVCGSFLAKDDGCSDKAYNRGFFVKPDGNSTYFDKRHLFSMGGEAKILSPGRESRPLIEYKSWKLSMIICYDLRFPAWCRNVDLEYDAMIVPANWPVARSYPWRQLLSARAIENQAYYLGCDRSGRDNYGCYSTSDTMIVDYWGKIIASAESGIAKATLSYASLNKDRFAFTPWKDADRFTID